MDNTPSKGKGSRGARMAEPCAACGNTRGQAVEGTRGAVTCTRCGALLASGIYLGESYQLVRPFWHADPASVPAERLRYFDLTCLGANGIERRHGWYDPKTRLVIQVG